MTVKCFGSLLSISYFFNFFFMISCTAGVPRTDMGLLPVDFWNSYRILWTFNIKWALREPENQSRLPSQSESTTMKSNKMAVDYKSRLCKVKSRKYLRQSEVKVNKSPPVKLKFKLKSRKKSKERHVSFWFWTRFFYSNK